LKTDYQDLKRKTSYEGKGKKWRSMTRICKIFWFHQWQCKDESLWVPRLKNHGSLPGTSGSCLGRLRLGGRLRLAFRTPNTQDQHRRSSHNIVAKTLGIQI
jgi:hypothetical protein